MKIKKIRPIVIVFLSSLIIIGYGHGIGPIGFIEIIAIPEIFYGDSHVQNSYERDMFTSAFVLLIGQLILISSLFLKNKVKNIVEIISILILIVGFYILVYPGDDIRMVAFYSGLPFLAVAIQTLFSRIRELKKRTQ